MFNGREVDSDSWAEVKLSFEEEEAGRRIVIVGLVFIPILLYSIIFLFFSLQFIQ